MRVQLLEREVLSLRRWCKDNLPPIQPLDWYNPKYEQLVKDRASGKCYVFAHGSRSTIFDTSTPESGDSPLVPQVEAIHCYRAWHDTIHVQAGLAFTEPEELEVARLQRKIAQEVLGFTPHSALLLRLDLELHIQHYHRHRRHPDKQRAMIADYFKRGILCLEDVW